MVFELRRHGRNGEYEKVMLEFGRVLFAALFLAVLAHVLYFLSWLNLNPKSPQREMSPLGMRLYMFLYLSLIFASAQIMLQCYALKHMILQYRSRVRAHQRYQDQVQRRRRRWNDWYDYMYERIVILSPVPFPVPYRINRIHKPHRGNLGFRGRWFFKSAQAVCVSFFHGLESQDADRVTWGNFLSESDLKLALIVTFPVSKISLEIHDSLEWNSLGISVKLFQS